MNWAAESRSWPLATHSRFVTSGSVRWHIQDVGEGPVVLFLHGAGASAHSFADLIGDLSAQYRCVAVDLPGHGFSRRTLGARVGLGAVTSELVRLLETEGIAVTAIVGHSAGAALALALCLELEPKPRAVVTLNGAFEEFDGAAGWLFPLLAKLLALNPFTAPFFAATTTERNVAHLLQATGSDLPAEKQHLYYRLIRNTAHVSGVLAMMAAWDLRPLLRRLREVGVPGLLLAGAYDKAVPATVSERTAQALPEATAEVFPDLGHLMHEEAPERIAARIARFFEAQLQPRSSS